MSKRRLTALFLSLAAGMFPLSAAHAMDGNTIVIGCDGDYKPYTYVASDGTPNGTDVELAREAFGRMGYDVQFEAIVWENKDEYLSSGEIDCLWSGYTMSGREDRYTWAGPYMYSRQVAVVRADSGITTLSELTGRRAAVQASTTAERTLIERKSGNVPEMGEIDCFSSTSEVFAALRKGYVDVIAGHENVMRKLVRNAPDEYVVLSEPLYVNELGVAFEKDTHEEMAAELTAVLKEMTADGTAKAIVESYGLDAESALGGIN